MSDATAQSDLTTEKLALAVAELMREVRILRSHSYGGGRDRSEPSWETIGFRLARSFVRAQLRATAAITDAMTITMRSLSEEEERARHRPVARRYPRYRSRSYEYEADVEDDLRSLTSWVDELIDQNAWAGRRLADELAEVPSIASEEFAKEWKRERRPETAEDTEVATKSRDRRSR